MYDELLSNFPLATEEVCELLRKLTSVKSEWSWNSNIQRLHDRCQEINHRGCMYGILWSFKVLVLGDICIWHRSWHWFIVDVREHKLWVWGSAEKCGSPSNYICQKKSVPCRAPMQQHWEWGTGYTTWALKVPPSLFCKGSICHHWPHTTSSHNHQGCHAVVTAATVHHVAYKWYNVHILYKPGP